MKKLCGIAVAIVIIDQVIKYLLCSYMQLGESIVLIPSFFSLTLVKNTGVAFSLFSGSQIPIIILTFGIMIGLLLWVNKQTLSVTKSISFGLLYGGMVGNLMDRILRFGVIDYFDFTILGYPFAIFNFADICVVCGAILMLVILWKEDSSANIYRRTRR